MFYNTDWALLTKHHVQLMQSSRSSFNILSKGKLAVVRLLYTSCLAKYSLTINTIFLTLCIGIKPSLKKLFAAKETLPPKRLPSTAWCQVMLNLCDTADLCQDKDWDTCTSAIHGVMCRTKQALFFVYLHIVLIRL